LVQSLETISLIEKRVKVYYGDVGYGYESLFKEYLKGAVEINIEDPYIRKSHQISNLLRLLEVIVKVSDCKKINLVTAFDDKEQKEENSIVFDQIAHNLYEHNIEFHFSFSETLHDREIKLSNGWGIKMGRGLDYFQSLSGNYYQIGVNDMDLRPCLETNFDFYKS
jgi:ATP-dependent Lon protease